MLGTAAFADAALLADALAEHGERVVVSVDVRGGMVSTAGWTRDRLARRRSPRWRRSPRAACAASSTPTSTATACSAGSIATALARVADAVEGELLYSGGIGSLADLQALAALRHPRLAGVIVGKALYERRFTLAEAQAALCT